MNNMFKAAQTDAKYRSARGSLLALIFLSVVNLFSIPFMGRYWLFSAYVPHILAVTGTKDYLETGSTTFLIVCIVLGLISLVPYILCCIFSKKRVGWMIAALVLFSIETAILLLDTVVLLLMGDASFLVDAIFHVAALVAIIQGVVYGVRKNKLAAQGITADPVAPAEADAGYDADGMGDIQRALTLNRAKKLSGCAIKFKVFVNGVQVGVLTNGATLSLNVPGSGFELGVASEDSSVYALERIPAGYDALSYTTAIKMGMTKNTITLTKEA